LLRAVNLGARNKVPMPALRERLTAVGFADVRTYVQSGNLVVSSRHRSPQAVAQAVATVVRDDFGVGEPVVVRTAEQIDDLVAGNPFSQAAMDRPKQLHVMFLMGRPDPAGVEAIHADALTREVCQVSGEHLYIDFRDGVHGSRLTGAYFAKRLGVDGTARNWRTVLALADLAR
jgi:uncharacterized protein (DUF1697 family)